MLYQKGRMDDDLRSVVVACSLTPGVSLFVYSKVIAAIYLRDNSEHTQRIEGQRRRTTIVLRRLGEMVNGDDVSHLLFTTRQLQTKSSRPNNIAEAFERKTRGQKNREESDRDDATQREERRERER